MSAKDCTSIKAKELVRLDHLVKGEGYNLPKKYDTPEGNIRFGREYIEAMHKEFGSKEKALAAYLLGPGTAQRDYFPQMGAADPETRVKKSLRGKILPKGATNPETFGSVSRYIDRILGNSALGKSYQDEEKILSRVRTSYGGMY